jgi:hypothetical protein
VQDADDDDRGWIKAVKDDVPAVLVAEEAGADFVAGRASWGDFARGWQKVSRPRRYLAA